MIATILKSKKTILPAIAILLGIAALRCAWLWQPARQVELHQRHFLAAAQDRKWAKLYGFFDDEFRTPTGHDKKWALQQANLVLRQFFALEIQASETDVRMEGDTARVRSVIRLEGSGMQLAELAKTAVNQSTEPFEFTWKHKSWKPWDWQLVGVDHPLLHVASGLE